MQIRELRPDEHDVWLDLRALLWPDSSRDELAREQDEIKSDPSRNCTLVAAAGGGDLVGFVEVSIRDWAEGCSTRPVGYIEAWYVRPEHRRTGVGRRLIDAAERWAMSQGCTEMGSDAELDNAVSRQAHAALGYKELGAVVLFCKKLGASHPTPQR